MNPIAAFFKLIYYYLIGFFILIHPFDLENSPYKKSKHTKYVCSNDILFIIDQYLAGANITKMFASIVGCKLMTLYIGDKKPQSLFFQVQFIQFSNKFLTLSA